MKAMIFAAGLGTRLRPITDSIPKAMVSIGGKPLLQHIIEKLKCSGFDEIIINVHHFADQIIDFIVSNNSFDIRIEISDETEKLLDTGGAIKKAKWFFDDEKPFLIHNVDILSNIDFNQLYNIHISKQAYASLVVSNRDTFRYLLFDDSSRLNGWINENTGQIKSPYNNIDTSKLNKMAFSGIQVVDPLIFDCMEDYPEVFSIIDLYLSICNKKEVISFVPDNFKMIDVGKIDVLSEAEEFITSLQ